MFISIFVINSLMGFAQMMMGTIVSPFVKTLGANATMMGTVSSVFAITALGIRPFASPAFDSFSKKKLLIISMAIVTVSFAIFCRAKTVGLVIAARLLQGIGSGCAAPLSLALASDVLPDEKLGSGIAIFSLGQAFAQAVGPSLGIAMSKSIGYQPTFMIGTAALAVSVSMLFFIKDQPHADIKYRITLDRIVAKEAIIPAVLLFFLSITSACIGSFITVYGGLRGIDNIGLYFTANAIFLLLIRPFSGKLADRFGFDKVIIPGIIFFVLTCVAIAMAKNIAVFIVAAALSAIGYGTCHPAIQALCMKRVPKERRGAGGNTNYIGTDLGMLLGPIIAGKVIDMSMAASVSEVGSYSVMFYLAVIPLVVALGFFLFVRKRMQQESK